MHKFKMGNKARDVLTNFSGVITARVEYLTGCTQYCIQPEVDEKGSIVDGRYFDETRLVSIAGGVTLPEPEKDTRPLRGADPYSTPPVR